MFQGSEMQKCYTYINSIMKMFPKGIQMQKMLHIYKEYNENISHKDIMEKYSTFSAVSML